MVLKLSFRIVNICKFLIQFFSVYKNKLVLNIKHEKVILTRGMNLDSDQYSVTY